LNNSFKKDCRFRLFVYICFSTAQDSIGISIEIKMVKLKLKSNSNTSKYQQLVDAFIDAINHGKYSIDEPLPSINQLSRELNVSRDTIFKAYSELKRRGLVESTPAKSYYVAGKEKKVFLFLDSYSPFKDTLYNSFAESLPPDYKVELAFHHYNNHVFDTVILDSIGKYNFYVIMNINEGPIAPVLKKLDSNKLLILDWGQYNSIDCSYVCQDFDEAVYSCLQETIPSLKKYQEFILYRPQICEHPMVSADSFIRFCRDNQINGKVVNTIQESDFKEGIAWFVFRQKELVEVLKMFRSKGLKTGEDDGLIAYNDTPLYEVIEGGISVISTDFMQMGHLAANFIVDSKKIQVVVPTRFIKRHSL
jgi:DNA-binding transcriptional regulator YhcF (GntR family)